MAGSEQCTQYALPVGAPELINDEYGSENPRPCGLTTAYIIIPTDCGSPENSEVERILFGMDPTFQTSRSPWCQAENAVMIWLANLPPEKAMDLKGQTKDAVKTVMPDGQSRTEPLTPAPELMIQGRIPAAVGTDGRLKVRDQLEVQFRRYATREIADPSLNFLSNAPDAPKEDVKDYVYFKSAVEASQAQEVRVYAIGSGFDQTNPDVPHSQLEYIYGLGCRTRPNDDDEEGHDSCMVSRIGGETFGVFPNGPGFTIVKIGPALSAFFDSLAKGIRDFISKPYLTDRAVVHISGHWPAEEIDRDAITMMQQGIQALLNDDIKHARRSCQNNGFYHRRLRCPFCYTFKPFLVWTENSRNINRPGGYSKRARLRVLLRQGNQCRTLYWVGHCRCCYGRTGGILSRYPGFTQVFYGPAEFYIGGEAICDCNVVSEERARR